MLLAKFGLGQLMLMIVMFGSGLLCSVKCGHHFIHSNSLANFVHARVSLATEKSPQDQNFLLEVA